MNFFILISLALFAAAQADVSHLTREYLPPVATGSVLGNDANTYGFVDGVSYASQPEAHQVAAPEYQAPAPAPEYQAPAEQESAQSVEYAQPEQYAEIIPGGDASSYQPAHLVPESLQSAAAAEEQQASFEYNNYIQSTNGIEDYQGASSASSSGLDTQYAPNGGYVY